LFDAARKAGQATRSMLNLALATPIDYPFADSDVAQLQRLSAAPDSFALDDQTWSDLLLPAYLASVSNEVSIAGRRELYRRLRAGLDDPARIAAASDALRPLRGADTEIASLLFAGEPAAPPRWLGWTWLLPLAVLVSLAAVILSPLAWIATAAALYALMALQMRYHERVETWQRSLNTVQLLLLATSRPGANALGEAPDAGYAVRLNRSLSRSFLARLLAALRVPGSGPGPGAPPGGKRHLVLGRPRAAGRARDRGRHPPAAGRPERAVDRAARAGRLHFGTEWRR
jgi:hypothetical protein